LFRFLSQLLIAAPEVSCVVVGGVPHDARADARWRRRWCGREMAGASGRVVFTGWLPQAAALAHYATASVLVVPSRVETFGLVALEGMLYGIPVVATASGGLADMIRDGGTGVLVPSGDVGRLVWAVRELLANSQRARRLGMAAAVDVRRTWLWPLVIPRLLGVYRELA
jgi:glycosyltransferase involved in cell wall biosynthesis